MIQSTQVLKKRMLALSSNYYELANELNMKGSDVHDFLCGVTPVDNDTLIRIDKALELLYWRTKSRIELAFGKSIN